MTDDKAHRILTTWTNALSDKQLKQLEWLRAAKCTVEAEYAPPDPLHGLREGVVVMVLVDQHAVVKIRGDEEEIPQMFDKAFEAAQNLFTWVNEAEEQYKAPE